MADRTYYDELGAFGATPTVERVVDEGRIVTAMLDDQRDRLLQGTP